jgi:hypothetical protein
MGQANYAASNSCIEAFAGDLNQHGTTALAIQWGAWSSVGEHFMI